MGRDLSTPEMLSRAELVRLGGTLCCVIAGLQPMGEGVGASLEMGSPDTKKCTQSPLRHTGTTFYAEVLKGKEGWRHLEIFQAMPELSLKITTSSHWSWQEKMAAPLNSRFVHH